MGRELQTGRDVQVRRRGGQKGVFKREEDSAWLCIGVAFPPLNSGILQSANGFPSEAISLPTGEGCLAVCGAMFACHRSGKEKGDAPGSWSVGGSPPRRAGWLASNAAGGCRRRVHVQSCAARGSAVLFWDRDRESSGLTPGEVGSSGWASKTSQG